MSSESLDFLVLAICLRESILILIPSKPDTNTRSCAVNQRTDGSNIPCGGINNAKNPIVIAAMNANTDIIALRVSFIIRLVHLFYV